jgi:hypothetical protein
MSDVRVNLSPPWYGYQRRVTALFGSDPDITVSNLVSVGQGQYSFSLVIQNDKKAQAIKNLLVSPVDLGNTTLQIQVLDATGREAIPALQGDIGPVITDAFSRNPVFSRIIVESLGLFKIPYCIFKKQVLQFWNDDFSCFSGQTSILAEDIAREILHSQQYVSFCTDTN